MVHSTQETLPPQARKDAAAGLDLNGLTSVAAGFA
jgi:hypothetical protein